MHNKPLWTQCGVEMQSQAKTTGVEKQRDKKRRGKAVKTKGEPKLQKQLEDHSSKDDWRAKAAETTGGP